MKIRRRQRGYTLLEITVAFAIMVVSLSVLLESFSFSDSRIARASHLEQATLLAQSVRDRFRAASPRAQSVMDRQEGGCRWSLAAKALARPPFDHPHPIVAYDTVISAACGVGGDAPKAVLRSIELGGAP